MPLSARQVELGSRSAAGACWPAGAGQRGPWRGNCVKGTSCPVKASPSWPGRGWPGAGFTRAVWLGSWRAARLCRWPAFRAGTRRSRGRRASALPGSWRPSIPVRPGMVPVRGGAAPGRAAGRRLRGHAAGRRLSPVRDRGHDRPGVSRGTGTPPRRCACCRAACSPRGASTGSPPAATRGMRRRWRCLVRHSTSRLRGNVRSCRRARLHSTGGQVARAAPPCRVSRRWAPRSTRPHP
jgi:hypothetical protein